MEKIELDYWWGSVPLVVAANFLREARLSSRTSVMVLACVSKSFRLPSKSKSVANVRVLVVLLDR